MFVAEFIATRRTKTYRIAEKISRAPAKIYKFKLDTFQQEAVDYIEKGESVLVAAHTSAGKTAVAEYAIAKSLRDGQRVIYTSPIKALSNQKYRDLQEEFTDVGLMTGDMTINPNATCLIMTTEILRSMLYRGSEVMRQVAWVIYDEVHYMRDKERGVVWEESIILLPHKVRFVFLSATIPNAPQFVSWVSKIHHQPCHVVYTDYRPVPLQHFVFPAGSEGLYLVVDEKGKFREENFQKAMACMQGDPLGLDLNSGKDGKDKKKPTKSITGDLFKIVKLVMEKGLDPCIVFSFSKKDCESYALQMARLDFNSDEEKDLVEQVFVNAIEALSEDDKTLPQVITLLPLLKRGVGIHHGGLLPILKEVIEILFQEGLIKCLFATETFSIGINMPAKTVVFTKTRKFDGKDFRWITSGEYIQMSGRAGRRGKDDRGIVIQMLDEKVEPDVAKNMIYGASDPLHSSYHVSYNMVLNMLRVQDANPENLIRSSFHQYEQEQGAPLLEQQAEQLQLEASRITIENESDVAEYVNLKSLLYKTQNDIAGVMMQLPVVENFLQPGRMLNVQCYGLEWGWGAIVKARTIKNMAELAAATNNVNAPAKHKSNFDPALFLGLDQLLADSTALDKLGSAPVTYLDIMLEVSPAGSLVAAKVGAGAGAAGNADASSGGSGSGVSVDEKNLEHLNIRPVTSSDASAKSSMIIVHVLLSTITNLSAVKIDMPRDLSKEVARAGVQKTVKEVLRRFPGPSPSEGGLPILDPSKDLAIDVEKTGLDKMLVKKEELRRRLSASPVAALSGADLGLQLSLYDTKAKLLAEANHFKAQARDSHVVTMREQLRKMKRVLRRLEYVDASGVLATKGRFSCELSTGDELVLTNMVFEGVFNELTVDQAVGLLSCFVHREASKDNTPGSNPRIRGDMQASFRLLQTAARDVAKISLEALLTMDEEEYVSSFNPGLVDVAYAWSSGSKFIDICKLTDVFEGSIIRVLRRLEELLRQLAGAALAIGNTELMDLFEEGGRRIRRGVVFAASLYI